MIESELKYRISSTDYSKLRDYFSQNYMFLNTLDQKNHYFDTLDFNLKWSGASCRIREFKSAQSEFTVKAKIDEIEKKNTQRKKEMTIPLANNIAKQLIEEECLPKESEYYKLLADTLCDMNFDCEVGLIGSLSTKRDLYQPHYNNDKICLDKSTYFGVVDYEVEWETTDLDGAESVLMKIFNKFDIVPKGNDDSKSTRFQKKLCEVDQRFAHNLKHIDSL